MLNGEEVKPMEKISEKVFATLIGSGWAIECSTCGPVAVTDSASVDQFCHAHLQEHR